MSCVLISPSFSFFILKIHIWIFIKSSNLDQIIMARTASEFILFLFLMSILLVCSSGLTPVRDSDQQEIEREEEQFFHLFHRELLNELHNKATKHDLVNTPIVYPSTPVTNPVTTPSISPPNVPAPAVVNVPGAIPSAPPVSIPNTNPVNTPLPVTNPVTTPSTYPGAQPVTNPVTNPVPTGGVPVATPGTIPIVPPGITNAPGVPGQSWCVARSGAPESALQAALDYSCGIGGADCSAIQQGGSCYNPNSLENHASYAFNSYYQKNPVQTSCDFGGTAMITNTNPSSGSCIYPASSSASSLPPPVTENPTPASPTPSTESSTGTTIPGAGTPPFMLNTSNPAAGGTITGLPDSPPSVNTSTSMSSAMKPFVGCIILVTTIITGKHIFDV